MTKEDCLKFAEKIGKPETEEGAAGAFYGFVAGEDFKKAKNVVLYFLDTRYKLDSQHIGEMIDYNLGLKWAHTDKPVTTYPAETEIRNKMRENHDVIDRLRTRLSLLSPIILEGFNKFFKTKDFALKDLRKSIEKKGIIPLGVRPTFDISALIEHDREALEWTKKRYLKK